MEVEVPAMVVQGCEVKEMTAVTGEARRPSPKSPWSEVGRRVSYVGLRVELVPVVLNGLFLVTIRNCLFFNDSKCKKHLHFELN